MKTFRLHVMSWSVYAYNNVDFGQNRLARRALNREVTV